jgi:hypothetical protein
MAEQSSHEHIGLLAHCFLSKGFLQHIINRSLFIVHLKSLPDLSSRLNSLRLGAFVALAAF